MVDQAHIAAAAEQPGASAPRAVAHNMAELGHDAITLAELQIELLRHDVNEALGRVVVPTALLAGSALLLLSCIPLALVCVALFISEETTLTLAQSFLLTLALGLVLGGVVAFIGAWLLSRSFDGLTRSKKELQQNVRWIKTMFKRIGSATSRRQIPDFDDRYMR